MSGPSNIERDLSITSSREIGTYMIIVLFKAFI